MGTSTPNYALYKPDGTEFIDEQVDLNQNWDKVDTQLKSADNGLVSLDSRVDVLEAAAGSVAGVNSPWTNYVPTITGINSIGSSGSSLIGRYKRLGSTVFGYIKLGFGTSGVSTSPGTSMYFSLPPGLTWKDPGISFPIPMGPCMVHDFSVGSSTRVGLVMGDNTMRNRFFLMVMDWSSSPIDTTNPIPFAAQDSIWAQFTYETDAA